MEGKKQHASCKGKLFPAYKAVNKMDDKGVFVDIYVDLKIAFDKVHHKWLLVKLDSQGKHFYQGLNSG